MPGMGVGGGQRLWPPPPSSVSGRCVPARGPLGLAERPQKPIRDQASFTPAACCLRHLRTAFVACLLGSTPIEEEGPNSHIHT